MFRLILTFFILISSAVQAELIDIEGYANQKEAESFLKKTFPAPLNTNQIVQFLNTSPNGKLKVLLGTLIYKQTKDLNKAMAICGPQRNRRQCWYGVMSAFAEQRAGTNKDLFLKEIFQVSCQKGDHFILPICGHSMGHAFLEFTKSNIQDALKMCSNSKLVEPANSFCESGVFNHYFLQHKAILLKQDKLVLEPCTTDSGLNICLKYKFLSAKEDKIKLEKNYSRYCSELGPYALDCFTAIGGSIEAEKLKGKTKKLSELCLQGTVDERWPCYRALFKTFVYEIGTKQEAINQCSSLDKVELKKKCSEFVKKAL